MHIKFRKKAIVTQDARTREVVVSDEIRTACQGARGNTYIWVDIWIPQMHAFVKNHRFQIIIFQIINAFH